MLPIRTIGTRTAATYLSNEPWRRDTLRSKDPLCHARRLRVLVYMPGTGWAYQGDISRRLAHLVLSLVRARCRSIMSCDNRHTSANLRENELITES